MKYNNNIIQKILMFQNNSIDKKYAFLQVMFLKKKIYKKNILE